MKTSSPVVLAAVLTCSFALAGIPAPGGEADARQLLSGMSEYLSGLEQFSFSYDSTLEVVTTDDQVLGIAASGDVSVRRPNGLHATRKGGFTELEMVYDGDRLILIADHAGVYSALEAPTRSTS